jgi:hypothetical protein
VGRVLTARTAAAEKPAAPPEASLLPVLDKPVTLSFKGGLSLSKAGAGAGVAKPAVFDGADDDDDAQEEELDAHAAKGRSSPCSRRRPRPQRVDER